MQMDDENCFAIILVTAGAAGHGITTLSSKTTPHRISLMAHVMDLKGPTNLGKAGLQKQSGRCNLMNQLKL